ncbi:LysR family transcriptional regulator [Comamonas sp.]|uniref:LysR family transcriptional regulator n=1 Tax=Comamonas sp. TaxID=34028 RepID=UPI0012D14443|nr:LysR family transcriptional regulator [Comamonas sp.]MPS93289.1 LysR family transcriptional regulator [Comamonas sp.]
MFMQGISETLANAPGLTLLRSFCLVVQERSFSQAAELLQLSQPAVSLQVRQLERQLGTRLIERVGRRAVPTAAGQTLLEQLPAVTVALEGLAHAMSAHIREVNGQVRIGTGLTVCLYLLPAVLRQIRIRHPGIDIVVVTGNTDECLKRVEDNSLDLALVTLPVNRRALLATPVLHDELVAVARPDMLTSSDAVAARELSTLPLLALQKSASTRGVVDAWLRRAGDVPHPQMELDSVEALKEMAAIGLGYAVVPRMAMQGRGARDDLVSCPLTPRLERTLAMVLRKDKPLSRPLSLVCQSIQEHCAAWAKQAKGSSAFATSPSPCSVA